MFRNLRNTLYNAIFPPPEEGEGGAVAPEPMGIDESVPAGAPSQCSGAWACPICLMDFKGGENIIRLDLSS